MNDNLEMEKVGVITDGVGLSTDDFDYQLPDELIAQSPLKERDLCRLICLDKKSGNITHNNFKDLLSLLKKGDRLVFNNTRVVPARVFGLKDNGLKIEFLFIEKVTQLSWKALVGPARRLKTGSMVKIENCSEDYLRIDDVFPNGDRLVTLVSKSMQSIEELFEKFGHIPLPQYISRNDEEIDKEAYQTVFAEIPGAIAAPTAGLHFTDELLDRLRCSGIDFSYLTLHVGIGTFRPVKENDPRLHPMHEEYFELPFQTVNEIRQTQINGGRIIAVGTTVVRVLEHCSVQQGSLTAGSGKTKLMILPPYEFKTVDALITNFHLPKSTLLMLVSAFAGKERVLAAYAQAVKQQYRFYSYGDAMFLY